MKAYRSPFVCAVALMIPAALAWAGPLSADEPADEVRAAITRSLPFVEAGGVAWINEKKCVSCHRVGMMTWAFNEAAGRGFAVDRDKLSEWVDWSLTKSLSQNEKTGQLAGATNLDGVAQLLLGRPSGTTTDERSKSYASLAALLAGGQSKGGSWAPAGQLPSQKRPLAETTEVSTMWNALALADGHDSSPDIQAVIQQATDRVSQSTEGTSTEWRAAQLLFAATLGNADQVATWSKRLCSVQNADGGWGWIAGESSDALATGISLYALCRTGADNDDPAVQAAKRFLVATQQVDGSWDVLGTKEKKKDHVEETSTYWGTAWATIGLLQTLPAGN